MDRVEYTSAALKALRQHQGSIDVTRRIAAAVEGTVRLKTIISQGDG